MEKITCAAEIKIAIQNLEFEREIQGQLLKEQFLITFESLKPINLIKNTLHEITSSPYLIDNLLGAVTGMVGGYLSRVLTVGASNNLFKKIAGSILQFGVTNVVANHSDIIRMIGNFISQKFLHKNKPDIANT